VPTEQDTDFVASFLSDHREATAGPVTGGRANAVAGCYGRLW